MDSGGKLWIFPPQRERGQNGVDKLPEEGVFIHNLCTNFGLGFMLFWQ
jgi:hypothetical protein